jgi:hypothetical protein
MKEKINRFLIPFSSLEFLCIYRPICNFTTFPPPIIAANLKFKLNDLSVEITLKFLVKLLSNWLFYRPL